MKLFSNGKAHGRQHELTQIRNTLMALADNVAIALAKLDTFVNKEAADQAEIASLKQQLDAATARAVAAEAAIASASVAVSSANDAAAATAADVAAVQPLLDKINALPVA